MKNRSRVRGFLFAMVIFVAGAGLLSPVSAARNDKKVLRDAGGVIKGKVKGNIALFTGGNMPVQGRSKMRVDVIGKGVARKVKSPTEFGIKNGMTVITKVMGKVKFVKNGKGIRNLKQKTAVRNPDFKLGPPPNGSAFSKANLRGKTWKWVSKVVSRQVFTGFGTDIFRGTLKGKG